MKLFDFVLPPRDTSCAKMYLRSFDGKENFSRDESGGIILFGGEAVSLDTYFNCFSYSKYLKHTKVEKLRIRIAFKGQMRVCLMHCYLNDSNGENPINSGAKSGDSIRAQKNGVTMDEELLSLNFESEQRAENYIDYDITSLSREGFIYIKIVSQNAGCVFYGGGYETEIEQENKVKVGLVICTYRREDYVKSNVRKIKEFLEKEKEYSPYLSIFVVDNGNTLCQEDISGATLFSNRNLGGSGGFTRGIIELHKRKDEGYTHFLLTDDDISFENEIFKKTINILRSAKNIDSLSLGAAMLRSDLVNYQHEMGAHWEKDKVKPLNHGFDLADKTCLVKNEEETNPDYTAWWYTCMPLSMVDKHGLPLPFFIKGDDVEYGLRCAKEIMLVNGLGVWHEPFENKFSAELEYYIKRNELVVAVLHGRHFFRNAIRKLVGSVGRQLMYQRYFTLWYIFKAYKDFLKGADFLLSLDGQKLHQELRDHNVKQLKKDELEKQGFDVAPFYVSPYKKRKTMGQILSLNEYLLPSFTYAKVDKKGYRIVDMTHPKPKDFYKSKRVLQYNEVTMSGFVTVIKRREVFRAGLKVIGLFLKLLICKGKVKRSFKKNFSKLTSLEHWNHVLFD